MTFANQHFETAKASLAPITGQMIVSLTAINMAALVTTLTPMFPKTSFQYSGPEYNYIFVIAGPINEVTGAIKYLQGNVTDALIYTPGTTYG